MYASDKGELVRSRPITYAANTTTNVDMSFLDSIAKRLSAPVIRELILTFNGSISGTTGGFVGDDACQIYSNIQIKDQGGIVHELPGKVARTRYLMEVGARGETDADGGGDVASGATNAAYRFHLRIPFDLEQARCGSDTALPVLHLLTGEMNLSFGAAPAAAVVNSGTITVTAVVHDEGRRELKSRMVAKMFSVAQAENDYILNGSTRLLLLTTNPATTGLTDWTYATFPTIDVPELNYWTQDTDILRSEWRRLRVDRAPTDPIVGTGVGVKGIPLIVPSRGQRADKLPNLGGIRIRLPAAPVAAAQLLMVYLEDRYPALGAAWMGYDSVEDYVVALNGSGKVKLEGGELRDPINFDPRISRRLPMVIEGR